MQLLILNANSIIWGVDKSLNWNHMKKHFEKKNIFTGCWGNGIGEQKYNCQTEKPTLQRRRLLQRLGSMALLPSTCRTTVPAES